MSILNLYQLALVSTIIGTVVAANWARKQRGVATNTQSVPCSLTIAQEPPIRRAVVIAEPNLKTIVPDFKKLAGPVAESVRERINALDKLFDENVISVEEYVELRKRALG